MLEMTPLPQVKLVLLPWIPLKFERHLVVAPSRFPRDICAIALYMDEDPTRCPLALYMQTITIASTDQQHMFLQMLLRKPK